MPMHDQPRRDSELNNANTHPADQVHPNLTALMARLHLSGDDKNALVRILARHPNTTDMLKNGYEPAGYLTPSTYRSEIISFKATERTERSFSRTIFISGKEETWYGGNAWSYEVGQLMTDEQREIIAHKLDKIVGLNAPATEGLPIGAPDFKQASDRLDRQIAELSAEHPGRVIDESNRLAPTHAQAQQNGGYTGPSMLYTSLSLEERYAHTGIAHQVPSTVPKGVYAGEFMMPQKSRLAGIFFDVQKGQYKNEAPYWELMIHDRLTNKRHAVTISGNEPSFAQATILAAQIILYARQYGGEKPRRLGQVPSMNINEAIEYMDGFDLGNEHRHASLDHRYADAGELLASPRIHGATNTTNSNVRRA